MRDTSKFDAIIIGSGISGLTSAALLSRLAGKRVLVLEKHWVVGGQTHLFKRRGGFEWDVGIHYVGQLERDEAPQRILDLIAGDRLKWSKMPDVFDRFCYPDFEFGVPSRRSRYEALLIARYPTEEENIKAYFGDVKRATLHFGGSIVLGAMRPKLRQGGRSLLGSMTGLATMTTEDYLNSRFSDEELKTLLASQWGDIGLPPSMSSFGTHAAVVSHYFDGGYYPVGGGKAIAKAILPTIEASGGEVLTRRNVVEIVHSNNRAVGVKVERQHKGRAQEEIYHADMIISTVGAYNTYVNLVEHPAVLPLRDKINALGQGPSAVTAYLGLSDDPRKLGVEGENFWIYRQKDHERVYKDAHLALEGNPQLAYLSFPSLKNPLAKSHTAELITLMHHDAFKAWQSKPWLKRGEDYDALKKTIADGLLNLAETKVPGLKAMVTYQEVSTPVTVSDFTSWPAGAFYGLPCTPQRFKQGWLGVHTPIKGLYLGGSDVSSMGIMGALLGGVSASLAAMGPTSTFKLARALRQNPAPESRLWTPPKKPQTQADPAPLDKGAAPDAAGETAPGDVAA